MSLDLFARRHIGPSSESIQNMLRAVGFSSMEQLTDSAVPRAIRLKEPMKLPPAMSEHAALDELRSIASRNKVFKNYIGAGYYGCLTPTVILRNIFENPGWYTQYTPYQSEIAQGRLEALLNFQTMVSDLTALPIANASLLDEPTAAAEAMTLCLHSNLNAKTKVFYVAADCHPQSIAVVRTRAEPLGIQVRVLSRAQMDFIDQPYAVMIQYPGTSGEVFDPTPIVQKARSTGAMVVAACDLLSLTQLKPPGEWGADVAIGSAQRFGVPMGFGGPHAAFMSTKDEWKRLIPGRIVGVSKDARGKIGLRLALQTREQHIRREKATSNICTSQVLLAIMAGMYAVYHGPKGLGAIAHEIRRKAYRLAKALQSKGLRIEHELFFDTVCVTADATQLMTLRRSAEAAGMNFRYDLAGRVLISIDETTTESDMERIAAVFGVKAIVAEPNDFPDAIARSSRYLSHPVFNSYHSETRMLRYIRSLEGKDLSLAHAMIPLGSCTMKLNATSELIPVSWPEFSSLHPMAPIEQAKGYESMARELETLLARITGFDAVSLQPNAGSQGEYAGLLVIRKYHQARGQAHRNVCLIPKSAHGTNPASAAMAGFEVVVVECDSNGNVDLTDLKRKAEAYSGRLAALMVTYPSTHGVFESSIKEICSIIHESGGQVYMDGANMNAQVGLCRPGDFGADVCHLNLHKTFCIPHGGGGPGMGPICVKSHLTPHLPGHIFDQTQSEKRVGAVSGAPLGSASILPISWMYIRMMGEDGLRQATQVAILNANYVAKRLENHYPILYKGESGLVAHECIIDLRPLKATSGVEVEDVAKRLMDYGFHAPTISFPVPGTMMIEPTESEDQSELDYFCDAMIAIRAEISEIESGTMDRKNNLLKNAPHSSSVLLSDAWDYPYARQRAAYPLPWVQARKFWVPVSRIDNVYGDRNLTCACPPIEDYMGLSG